MRWATRSHARILCRMNAQTSPPTPDASAQQPTKISTAPYPNRPNPPPNAMPFPDSKSIPETMGPITAEMPLERLMPPKAMTVNSGLLPAMSAAAIGHVEENPPL